MEITLSESLLNGGSLALYQPLNSRFWTAGNSVRLICDALEIIRKSVIPNLTIPPISILIERHDLLNEEMKRTIMAASSEIDTEVEIISLETRDNVFANSNSVANSTSVLLVPFDPNGEALSFAVAHEAIDSDIYVNLTLTIIPHFSSFLSRTAASYHPSIYCAARNIYADLDSITVFDSLMRARSSTLVSDLPFSTFNQYMHPKILDWLNKLVTPGVFIDCGSTNAREIEAIVVQCPDAFSNVIAFDPGSEEKCFRIGTTSVELYPKAVLANEGSYYLHGHGIGARVSPTQIHSTDEAIEATSIDQLQDEHDVSNVYLIRMDIEGSEFEALIGARQTIKEHMPALVICLYHRPSDIIRIPLLIASIAPGYNFYIGHHNKNCLYETVLYCEPAMTFIPG